LYFLYAAFIVYAVVDGYQAATQPGVVAPGLLFFSALFAGFAAFWGALGVLELRGHHHQNISGSILSMLVLAGAGLLQDAHIDTSDAEALSVIFVTAMLGLNDLRTLPEKRVFSAVLSVDALLLISFSLIAKYPKSVSALAAVVGTAGTLCGIGMLGFGLLGLIMPPRPLGTKT